MGMRTILIAAALVLGAACSGSPTAPSRAQTPAPTDSATLSITVVGHITGRPLSDLRAELDPQLKPFRSAPSRARAGAASEGYIAGSTIRFTDANGQARWTVAIGAAHSIRIHFRDHATTVSGLVSSDAGWLVSVPE